MPLIRSLESHQPSSTIARLAAMSLCSLTFVAATAVAPTARAANVGEIETLASAPVDLTSLAVDTSTNIVYAQQNAGQKFYSYDPRTNTWTELAEAPISSGNNGGATYVNGRIYTSYTGSSEVGVYNIESNTWSTIPSPLGQGTADITSLGENLYMAVGRSFVKYDTITETTTELATPSVEFQRWGGLQPYEGKIYGDTGNGHKTAAVYDLETNSWQTLPELPEGAAAGSALDPAAGTYYATGDYGAMSIQGFNIAANSWSTIVLPFAIGDTGEVYVSLRGFQGIYISAGEDGTGFARLVTAPYETDLSLTNTASPSSVEVGGDITYTMRVSNAGTASAPNTTVSDTLPAGASVVYVQPSQGLCSTTPTVTCHLGGLAGGASATVTLVVKTNLVGSLTNTASVSSTIPDSNPANNSASATVIVKPVAVAAVATGPASAKAAVAVKLAQRKVSGHTVKLKVTCRKTGINCAGKLSLAWVRIVHGRTKTTLLGRASYTLASGKSKTFVLRLTANGLATLRRAGGGGLRVRARASTREGGSAQTFARLKS